MTYLSLLLLFSIQLYTAIAAPAPTPATATSSALGSRLRQAASTGDLQAVKELIGKGVDVNEADPSPSGVRAGALHLATWAGHSAVMSALLEAGADPNVVDTHNRTALHFTVIRTPKEAIEALVKRGGNLGVRSSQNWLAVHMAVLANNSIGAQALIELGSDVNDKGGPFEVTPLFLAVAMRQREIVEKLLEKGADVNARAAALQDIKGSSPIFVSLPIRGLPANEWHTKSARQLLSLYADPAEYAVAEGRDLDHYAPLAEHKETVKLLLESGMTHPPPNASFTPLLFAARLGYAELVEVLLAKGADPTAADPNGWTPLHWAAYYGFTDSAQALVRHGAKVGTPTAKDQVTPLELASMEGHTETAKVLGEAGRVKRASMGLMGLMG